MSNLYVAAEYKNKIINLLIRNKDFVKLVNPSPSKCPDLDIADILLGGTWIINGQKYQEQGHVFDYDFVDDTTVEEKTFVFVETDIDTVIENTFMNFNLYIYIFADKSLVRLNNMSVPTAVEVKNMGYFANSHGNRIDVLCDIVDRTINGSDKIEGIGNVEPSKRYHLTRYNPNYKYYGKCLKYSITNYNSGGNECGN